MQGRMGGRTGWMRDERGGWMQGMQGMDVGGGRDGCIGAGTRKVLEVGWNAVVYSCFGWGEKGRRGRARGDGCRWEEVFRGREVV